MTNQTPDDRLIRVFDVTLSLVFIVAFIPFLSVISLLLFFFHGRPIFFVQTRLGQFGEEFQIFKFRTMILRNRPDSYSTTANDPRVTALGKFLRRSSLDEIPQLFNVLLGDMSLVGPRPDVVEQKCLYSANDLKDRLSVRPGLTGCAQIKYRSNATFEQRLRADLEWVRHRSLRMYLRVILLTMVTFRSAN